MRKEQPEYQLQKQVCQYLNIQYPKVMYLSDTVAAVKLTIPQQVRNKAIQKEGFKCPDLLILQPNKYNSGLFIELKAKTPYKSNGFVLLSNPHVEAQAETLNQLNKIGYYACFSWSFEDCKSIIDSYMKDATPRS